MNDLAVAYMLANRPDEASKLLEEASMSAPPDVFHACQTALLQVWFGMDAQYAATRQRMLKWAANTDKLVEASFAARLACPSPIPNAAMQEAALTLAQRAVSLMRTDPWVFPHQLVLGMAEYRSGHYPAAEQAFLAAEKGAKENPDGPCAPAVQSAAGFYRAMILLQKGKTPEAARLFTRTESAMKPLPANEKNPFADGTSYDDMILWLAFKEAKALLNETAAIKP